MPILDSSAVLAVLFGEPGHERVATRLSDALLSAVSFAKVIGVYARRTGDIAGTARVLDEGRADPVASPLTAACRVWRRRQRGSLRPL